MRNWPWRSLVLTVAGGFIVTVILVPDPSPQDLSSLSTSELVELLGSRRQVIREAAAGQLIARGKTVAPDLVLPAALASPAQLKEIMAVLEELMLASDEQIAESAESALEQTLASENRSAADIASEVLSRNTALRHTRAVAQINKLSGTVLLVEGNESVSNDTFDESMTMAMPRSPFTLVILLDHEWQGGDAGLKYVRRVGLGDPLSLHVTDDAPVTMAALQLLRAQRENTQVRHPHQGCMGVSYSEEASDPVISGIIPNSPAERAGLRSGDWITSVDGQPVQRFSQVASRAREHQPGETLELAVRRYVRGVEQNFRITLTLGSDFGTGVCRCAE